MRALSKLRRKAARKGRTEMANRPGARPTLALRPITGRAVDSGPPIDAPDPLQKYRWWILAAFAAVLVIGGVYVASKQQSAAPPLARHRSGPSMPLAMQEEDDELLRRGNLDRSRSNCSTRYLTLMEGIKEELFQLKSSANKG